MNSTVELNNEVEIIQGPNKGVIGYVDKIHSDDSLDIRVFNVNKPEQYIERVPLHFVVMVEDNYEHNYDTPEREFYNGGGKRKTRSKKYKSKRVTRRAGKKDRYEPLKMFHKVWKAYASNLK